MFKLLFEVLLNVPSTVNDEDTIPIEVFQATPINRSKDSTKTLAPA